jgi:hypothetical protein
MYKTEKFSPILRNPNFAPSMSAMLSHEHPFKYILYRTSLDVILEAPNPVDLSTT